MGSNCLYYQEPLNATAHQVLHFLNPSEPDGIKFVGCLKISIHSVCIPNSFLLSISLFLSESEATTPGQFTIETAWWIIWKSHWIS